MSSARQIVRKIKRILKGKPGREDIQTDTRAMAVADKRGRRGAIAPKPSAPRTKAQIKRMLSIAEKPSPKTKKIRVDGKRKTISIKEMRAGVDPTKKKKKFREQPVIKRKGQRRAKFFKKGKVAPS